MKKKNQYDKANETAAKSRMAKPDIQRDENHWKKIISNELCMGMKISHLNSSCPSAAKIQSVAPQRERERERSSSTVDTEISMLLPQMEQLIIIAPMTRADKAFLSRCQDLPQFH